MKVKKEEKHAALLQSALDLFAEKGIDNASTALIAKRAGVASGTLFFHFNSKEELIQVLFEEIQDRIERNVLANDEPEKPLKERLFNGFYGLLNYFLDHPDEFKFVEQYYFSPFNKYPNNVPDENETLIQLLLEARDRGLVKNESILFLKIIAFGPLTHLAKEHAQHGTPVDEHTMRQIVQACWDGLAK
ncbi:TetR/AcrR family transcriptional regulator [uncultured Desulfuromusa sp.]|uniref:TetR/AcrR family transcriptional regulator n=1 Tax=uncultured Desulfuromusa sp. TaxID=219183 RepID=UPI002AA64227|nr:TetR/AcrR family transcriptional regulator [uncultured Desulfuromusa sp.]